MIHEFYGEPGGLCTYKAGGTLCLRTQYERAFHVQPYVGPPALTNSPKTLLDVESHRPILAARSGRYAVLSDLGMGRRKVLGVCESLASSTVVIEAHDNPMYGEIWVEYKPPNQSGGST